MTVEALPKPVSPEVVERLRDLLAMAERGEIIAIAVAAHLTGQDESGCCYAVGERGSEAYLVGALETVKLRVLGVIDR